MCLGRSSKWNTCCTVSRHGAAVRPEDHTWGTNHVLHHCALELPLDGPSGQGGKQIPGLVQASAFVGWAASLGPSSGPSSPSSSSFYTIIYSEFFDCDTMLVIVNCSSQASPCLLTSQSKNQNCDSDRHEKELSSDLSGD